MPPGSRCAECLGYKITPQNKGSFMCGGMEFSHHPERLTDEEWRRMVRGTGAGVDKFLRVLFPNPKAALLVNPLTNLWLPWGRRKEQPGGWPVGGWAREESLDKDYWKRWHPEQVIVYPLRWMEKDRTRASRWFELKEGHGLLCLRLDAAPGTPLYVVTRPADGVYQEEVHERRPVVM